MALDNIERVAVIGAGSMGHGIAQVVAMAGYDVTLQDVDEERVTDGFKNISWSLDKLNDSGELSESKRQILDRIDTEVDLGQSVTVADFVIEAVPEEMALKKEVLTEIDRQLPTHGIIASNTSSLSITEMGSVTDRPDRIVGTHFFNPPAKMELVEIIHGAQTGQDTVRATNALIESFGKTAIHVRKDVRGFVVNNVLLPFMMEAAWMLSNGETTVEAVDAAMVHAKGYPMGPFELADLTGLDVGHDVYVEWGRPIPPALEKRVQAGELGRKTGSGYYDYQNGEGTTYQPDDGKGVDTLRIESRMVNEAIKLVAEDIASPTEVDTGMQLGAGFPQGICERGEEIGLCAVLEKLETLHEATGDRRFEPAPYLREMVSSGRTEIAAGANFSSYKE